MYNYAPSKDTEDVIVKRICRRVERFLSELEKQILTQESQLSEQTQTNFQSENSVTQAIGVRPISGATPLSQEKHIETSETSLSQAPHILPPPPPSAKTQTQTQQPSLPSSKESLAAQHQVQESSPALKTKNKENSSPHPLPTPPQRQNTPVPPPPQSKQPHHQAQLATKGAPKKNIASPLKPHQQHQTSPQSEELPQTKQPQSGHTVLKKSTHPPEAHHAEFADIEASRVDRLFSDLELSKKKESKTSRKTFFLFLTLSLIFFIIYWLWYFELLW